MVGRIPRWVTAAAAGAVGAGVAGAAGIARRLGKESLPIRSDDGYSTLRVVTVDRPMETVHELLSDAERLSVVLDRSVTMERLDGHRWRCTISGPAGGAGRGAEALVELHDVLARWQVETGPMAHEGHLELATAPGDRGTELRVTLSYPQGQLKHQTATLSGHDPDQMLRTLLRRAKSVIECGQVLSSMNEPSGREPAAEQATKVVREKLATGGRP